MKFNYAHLLLAFATGLMAAGGILVQNAHASQPHMSAALEDLRAARGELRASEDDKGGHRVRAVQIVDSAIEEVKAGIAYAGQ